MKKEDQRARHKEIYQNAQKWLETAENQTEMRVADFAKSITLKSR
jgi:hypothetical protein